MSFSASLPRIRLAPLAAAGLSSAGCKLLPLPREGAPSSSGGGTPLGTGAATGSTSAASTTSGTGGASPVDNVCAGAMPTNFAGMPTGFSLCPDHTLHRVEAQACDPTITAPECAGSEQMLACTKDSDCTAAARGKCVTNGTIPDTGVTTGCGCVYS